MTAPDPAALLAAMEAAAREATGGRWHWWTSCSWRRLRSESGRETLNVLMPFTSRSDGHPDMSVSAEDMHFIETCQPDAVLQLCAALRASQEREAAAVAAEREACVALVEAEPELPGDPPEILAEDIAKHPVEYMRVAVKATKRGIIAAIRARKDAAP